MIKKQLTLFAIALTSIMMLAAFSWVSAAPADTADLPPRPTEIPTTAPTAIPANLPGGLIILSAPITQTATADYWVEVEWQSVDTETWYTVQGWRGNFDSNGDITWWVAPENLGESPFRWVVYESEGSDSIIYTSDSFSLPSSNATAVVSNVVFD